VKYYVLITLLCAIPLKGAALATPTPSSEERQYYISHSPYYTRGYLASDTEHRQFMHGPSPYWRSRKISKPVNISLRKKYI